LQKEFHSKLAIESFVVYGVATISRFLETIGICGKRALSLVKDHYAKYNILQKKTTILRSLLIVAIP